MMTELTREYVRSLFDYKDGNLYWKVRKSNRICIGDKAGYLQNDGYYVIRIDGKKCYNHRIIFLYHKGYLPNEIDHIDNNSSNNEIKNLRDVTHQQNMTNQRIQRRINKSSEYKGVCWDNSRNKWVAHLKTNGKQKHLGRFVNEMVAARAYNKAAIESFGEYANLNIIDQYEGEIINDI